MRQSRSLWFPPAPENDETVVIRKLVLPEAGKYRPDQARAPAGQSDGGQWVDEGGITPMVEFRMDKEDAILPTRIVHNSEQIWHGNVLEASYNYLDYEFETEQHRYRARTYLDDIHEVAVYGPFHKDSHEPRLAEGIEVDQRVLGYLRRRFAEIKKLGPTGYEPIK